MSGAHTPAGLILGAYSSPAGLVAVGGGATVREIALADWPTRITDYTWADGDYARCSDTGALRRYDATAGDLVLPSWAGATGLALRARIQGSVQPSAESVAWTHYISGDGAITNDGTRVNCHATSTGYAQPAINHGLSPGKILYQGYVGYAGSPVDSASCQLRLQNGTYDIAFTLRSTSGAYAGFHRADGVLIGSHRSQAISTETWLEIEFDGVMARAYADLARFPLAAVHASAIDGTANAYWIFGDTSAVSGTGDMSMRQARWLTAT